MNVLIACEESQRVCKEFLEKGHNAYSCDLEKSGGGYEGPAHFDGCHCDNQRRCYEAGNRKEN